MGVPPLIGTCVDLSTDVGVFKNTVGRRLDSVRRAKVVVRFSRVHRRGVRERVASCVGRGVNVVGIEFPGFIRGVKGGLEGVVRGEQGEIRTEERGETLGGGEHG